MRVLFAILARFRADQPDGFDARITADDDVALHGRPRCVPKTFTLYAVTYCSTVACCAFSPEPLRLCFVGRPCAQRPILDAAAVHREHSRDLRPFMHDR
jgi:hypothetical protein